MCSSCKSKLLKNFMFECIKYVNDETTKSFNWIAQPTFLEYPNAPGFWVLHDSRNASCQMEVLTVVSESKCIKGLCQLKNERKIPLVEHKKVLYYGPLPK